jgi:hypothetical protein
MLAGITPAYSNQIVLAGFLINCTSLIKIIGVFAIMSIYYYGKLISSHDVNQKQASEPVLVGDIIKSRDDYQTFMNQKTRFVVRHYQDA